MADKKPKTNLTDEQIVTERKLPRRAFLGTTGALLIGGAAALVAGTRAAGQEPAPDQDAKKDADADKKKTGAKKGGTAKKGKKATKASDPDKAKAADPDKAK